MRSPLDVKSEVVFQSLSQFGRVAVTPKVHLLVPYFRHSLATKMLSKHLNLVDTCHAKYLPTEEILKLRDLSSFWGPPQCCGAA